MIFFLDQKFAPLNHPTRSLSSAIEVSKEEMRLLFVYIFVMFKEGLEYPFLALAML